MLDVTRRVRPGISQIQPYQPGLTDEMMQARFQIQRVLHLDANENALGPSPRAVEAIQQALPTLHLYPDGAAQSLKDAIADFHQVDASKVLVGNGSDNILKLLAETFLNPGDEVVSAAPSFPQYGFGAAIMGASIVRVPLVEQFAYDVEAMLAAVTERTKIVFICSPNNPTGTIATRAQVDWLLDRLPEDVLLVLDVAYNNYSANPERVTETERYLRDPRVIMLYTFSKLYGLAGLRVGYGLADPAVWQFVNRVREPFNVNRLAQVAAAAALTDESHRTRSMEHAEENRGFYETLAASYELDIAPTEANFVWLGMKDAKAVADELLHDGVMVRAGFPGNPRYMRLTFGTSEENEWVAQAFARVAKLGLLQP